MRKELYSYSDGKVTLRMKPNEAEDNVLLR